VNVAVLVGRLLGGAAALLGMREEAREYYQKALDAAEKIRFRPEMALTHLQLAELLLSSMLPHIDSTDSARRGHGQRTRAGAAPLARDREEAMRHLDIAIGEFRDMKMQPSLERALRHKEVLKA
jgi:hypothetical protein